MTHSIILAAGRGSRYKSFTRNIPRCMLPLGHGTLLDHQIALYKQAGINECHVITGHLADSVTGDAQFHFNENYDSSHSLGSLFLNLTLLQDDVVVSYGDILFSERLLEELMASPHDITVLCDKDWNKHYDHRLGKGRALAETLVMDGQTVREIGANLPYNDNLKGELVGLMRFKGKGLQKLVERYQTLSDVDAERPFQRARSFRKAALSDFLQDAIDNDIPVMGNSVTGGWLEIDTLLDYESIQDDLIEKGNLDQLLNG